MPNAGEVRVPHAQIAPWVAVSDFVETLGAQRSNMHGLVLRCPDLLSSEFSMFPGHGTAFTFQEQRASLPAGLPPLLSARGSRRSRWR